jgi:ribosomal protein S18 acetylase RimI-like enzyme
MAGGADMPVAEMSDFFMEQGKDDPRISLRTVQPDDMPFLRRVYAGTRVDELALTDWDDGRKNAFIDMQFSAQDAYYREVYPDAEYLVILVRDIPVGRLYVRRAGEETRIIDLTVLPEYRNRGIGTGLLREILAAGARHQVPVTIHVERMNPAMNLYQRLGFRLVEDKGVYLFLKWSPAAA